MFPIVSSDSASDNEGKDQVVDNEITAIKSAMQINIIIEYIYKLLCLEDIKSCRLVNQKLNFVAEPVLRKRAVIDLSHCNVNGRIFWSPDQFQQDFSSSNCTLPFTSFRLYGDGWNFPKLNQFFEVHGKSIKELKIFEISMREKNGDLIEETDISQLFKHSSGIVKLKLFCEMENPENNTILAINLDNLMSIKDLRLIACKMIIGSHAGKIKPRSLEMNNIELFQKGNKLTDYLINEAIDFSEAENIHIEDWRDEFTFDIPECGKLKKLLLRNVKVHNWAVSKCKINKFQTTDVSIVEETKMEIKELKFDGNTETSIELMGDSGSSVL